MKEEPKRRIAKAIDDAYIDLVISGILDEAKMEIRIKKDFPTASWVFNPPHNIFVGDRILEHIKESHEEEDEYIQSYLYHELGHSLYTERDMKAFVNALKSKDIPFLLLNIFEDARIEELMRLKTGRKFSWTKFEGQGEIVSPLSMFQNIIQNEGSMEACKDIEKSDRVQDYYLRSLACRDTWELIPLMEEWLKEFKEDEQDPQEGQEGQDSEGEKGDDSKEEGGSSEQGGSGDTSDGSSQEPGESGSEGTKDSGDEPGPEGESAAEQRVQDLKQTLLLLDDDAFESFVSDSESVEELLMVSPSGPMDTKIEAETRRVDEHSNAVVRSPYENEGFDQELADELTPLFARLFSDKKGYVRSSCPSKRLNIKGIARGSNDQPFRKRKVEKAAVKEVTLILDCSGSMHGEPMEGMRVIIGIFSRLAKRGHVKGHVILSGVSGRRGIHETFTLPVEDDIIGTFVGMYASEGLDHAMRDALPLLKKSDWTFVLTDGYIGDARIEKKFYHLQGVETLGIYIGDTDHCDLNEWFDKGVARKTIREVADELLQSLK